MSHQTGPDWTDVVFDLWDDLSAYEVGEGHVARQHLLTTLCSLLRADNADWIGVVRLPEIADTDLTRGWRPRGVSVSNPDPNLMKRIQQAFRDVDKGAPDVTARTNAMMAGAFRVQSLETLDREPWFEADAYRAFYRQIGRVDTIWIGVPIHAGAEVLIGVHRAVGRAPFDAQDREIAGFCLRGLKWFHNQQMLNDGLTIASAPLTGAEWRVLRGLLAGLSEKVIALDENQSPHTTHDHVKRLFRKYGVKSRSELMALWLDRAPTWI